ncbi:MAG: LemA family protein [Spirochaetes bacterium GWF1_41_5]|nr:MAG: LemA family protein [Spirochaetes bacterium GWF1_41_5]HBE03918.1 LemA family protein [Spirochaetia bacterium]
MSNLKTWQKALIIIGGILLILFIPYSCGTGMYNSMVSSDETVKASWSEVENQYQRRYDLIPNLVEVVKKYASHEKETLQAVTEARSRMGGVVNIPKDAVNNPEIMAKYRDAQASLGSALQRLMMVSENYPQLKANENFRDLQIQLEGTENRVTVARNRYNSSVLEHNKNVRSFPKVLFANMMGFKTAESFKMEEAAATAPKVKFD